jgi:hypothetical protein
MTIGGLGQALIAGRKMKFIWDRKEEFAPNAAVDLIAAGSLMSREEQ